jgi:hypothetical protein
MGHMTKIGRGGGNAYGILIGKSIGNFQFGRWVSKYRETRKKKRELLKKPN